MMEEVLIKLGVDGSSVSQGLRRLDPIISSWGDKVSDYLSKAFAPVAIGAAAGSVLAYGKSMIELASSLEHLAENTGVSTDMLQYWTKAARRVGVDGDTAEKALVKLAAKIGEARSGNEEAAKSFHKWGISLTDAAGNAKSVDAILDEVRKKNEAMGDATEAAAMRMDLFSKAGVKMGSVLQQLGKVEGHVDKIISEQDIARLHSAEVTLQRLTSHSKTLGAKLVGALATTFGLADPNAYLNNKVQDLANRDPNVGADKLDPHQAKSYIEAADALKKARTENAAKGMNDEGKLVMAMQKESDIRRQLAKVDDDSVDSLKLQKDLIEAIGQKQELIATITKKKAEQEKEAKKALKEQREEAEKMNDEVHKAQDTLKENKDKAAHYGDVNPTIAELAGTGSAWGGQDFMANAKNSLRNGPFRRDAQRAEFLRADELSARGFGNTERADQDKKERQDIEKRLSALGVTAPETALAGIQDATKESEKHLESLLKLANEKGIKIIPQNGA